MPGDLEVAPIEQPGEGQSLTMMGDLKHNPYSLGELSYSPADWEPDVCQGVLRTGSPCSARPLTGGILCVGHQRQWDKNALAHPETE